MIDVNPANPAEFLACCGLLELAHLQHPKGSLGWFKGRQFFLSCPTPIDTLIYNLMHGVVKEKKDKSVSIDINGKILDLDWVINPSYKCWSGSEYSYDLLAKNSNNRFGLQVACRDNWLKVGPMANVLSKVAAPTKNKASKHFNFDPRTAWCSGDLGYSPIQVGDDLPVFAYTELLAAIGLQRFRPAVDADEVYYSYFAWTHPLSAPVAAVAGLYDRGTAYRCVRKKNSKYGKFFNSAEVVSNV